MIAILASIYVISGLYRVFSTVVSFHKKTWIISSAAILQALVNIVLNFIFIPLFGMYAAAWSSLLSLVGYLAWIAYWSQRLEPVKLPWKTVSVTTAGVAMVLAVWYWLDQAAWAPIMLLYKFLLLAGFVLVTLRCESLQQVRTLLIKFYLKLRGKDLPEGT